LRGGRGPSLVFFPLPGLAQAPATGTDDWPTYHHDVGRSGVDPNTPAFKDVKSDWTSALFDGDVYAEPLYVGGQVIVVTENNSVYSVDSVSGATAWQVNLAQPADASQTQCTNIRPTVGITSTPTADPAAGLLYVVALLGLPFQYELFGLGLADGSVQFERALDAEGLTPRFHQQRGALGLANGRVYIPFGGFHGDCQPYRGRVVAVSATEDAAPLLQYVVPADRGGIWAPGGGAIDAQGNLYVATGNGVGTNFNDRSSSVLELSATLEEGSFWTAADLPNLNRNDIDIGSLAPTLLPDLNLVFQAGKNSYGYLLQAGELRGIGGELYASELLPFALGRDRCSGAWGGTAYVSPVIYLSCGTRIIALRATLSRADMPGMPGFSVDWAGPTQVRDVEPAVGSPIVAGGAVWAMDFHGHLVALDTHTGALRFQVDLPGVPTHFSTPSSGGGRIYAAAGRQLAAFILSPD